MRAFVAGADEVDTMAAICLLRARVYDMQQVRVSPSGTPALASAVWHRVLVVRSGTCGDSDGCSRHARCCVTLLFLAEPRQGRLLVPGGHS